MFFTNLIKTPLLVISLIILIGQCLPKLNDQEGKPDVLHAGMVKISSNGKTFFQGWNSPLAPPDEKPGMWSTFSHDYWIDTTETTQKQFYALTGRKPVSANSPFGTGDQNPVYFVSWFDAAWYCNERSKLENLDTCYVYIGKKISSVTGSILELTGVRSRLDCDGYRMPTEAEWEFADRGGMWIHPICFSGPLPTAPLRQTLPGMP